MNEELQPDINIDDEIMDIASTEKFVEAETLEKTEEIRAFSDTLDSEAGEDVRKALKLMVKLHHDQKDRPQEPYLNHTSNVALRLIKEFGVTDTHMIVSALLHDSVEDQSAKLAKLYDADKDDQQSDREKALSYISMEFGSRVEEVVSQLSNPETKEPNQAPEEKNRAYVDHVAEIITDPEVALIKLSDFLENVLRLDEITDTERRLKLSKKYLPVISLFIDRIQQVDISLNPDKKNAIETTLIEKRDETNIFIETTEHSKENRKTFLTRLENIGLSQTDIKDIDYAYDIAKETFRPEVRESGERYFEHLREVALILIDECDIKDRDTIIIALLHDAVEDRPIFGNRTAGDDVWIHKAMYRIKKTFGETVAQDVLTLTKPGLNDLITTKEEALDTYFLNMKIASERAILIKLADRLHNLRTLGVCTPEKRTRKIQETEERILPLSHREFKEYPKEIQTLQEKIENEILKFRKQEN